MSEGEDAGIVGAVGRGCVAAVMSGGAIDVFAVSGAGAGGFVSVHVQCAAASEHARAT